MGSAEGRASITKDRGRLDMVWSGTSPQSLLWRRPIKPIQPTSLLPALAFQVEAEMDMVVDGFKVDSMHFASDG